MKKQKLLFVLPAALALSLTAAAADARMEICPPEEPVRAGEAFAVTVELAGNPGVTGATLTLTYDHAQMTCTGAEAGALLRRAMADSNPDAPAGAMVAAASSSVITGGGTLAEFDFRADTDLSSFSFGLEGRLYDEDGAAVPFTVTTRGSSVPADPAPSEREEPSRTPTPAPTPEPSQTQEPAPAPTPPVTPGPSRTPEPVQPSEPEPAWTEEPEPFQTPEPARVPEPAPSETPTPAGTGTGGASASPAFSDIASHWAADSIRTAAERGLFGGYADGTFRPGGQVTRAQFVTVLWNLAGRPEPDGGAPFTDTGGLNETYRNAIAWAYRRGLVSGTSERTFSPYGLLTRQAAMKVLYEYHGESGGTETLLTSVYDRNYQDSGSISAWAKPGVYWAVYHEILKGVTSDTLNPGGVVTRAQLAVIMVRYTDRFPA